MKSLLAFALLAGCAWGQGQPTAPVGGKPIGSGEAIKSARIADCGELTGVGGRIYTLRQLGYCDQPAELWLQGSPAIYGGILHLAADQCETVLKMGNSTRAVKDVFTLECAPKSEKPEQKPCGDVVKSGASGVSAPDKPNR